jgi:hypothetical protein
MLCVSERVLQAAIPAWTADSDWQWGDVEEPVIRPKGFSRTL